MTNTNEMSESSSLRKQALYALDDLINTYCQEDTKFLRTKIIDYSDYPNEGCDHLENMCIVINKMRKELINYRTALTQPNQAQPANKMMLDALKAIVDFDDTNFITDMSDGVDSWQSNGLSSLISKAREAISTASSAPVVEVDGLDKALLALVGKEQFSWTMLEMLVKGRSKHVLMIVEAARIQLERQKGGV